MVVANVRRKNERKWTRLTWSLRESLVRIFSKENEKEELKQRQKMNKNISKTVQTGDSSRSSDLANPILDLTQPSDQSNLLSYLLKPSNHILLIDHP